MADTRDQLTDHIIVCGADETGRHVIETLGKEHMNTVVIERDQEKIKRVSGNSEVITVSGDATKGEVLEEAGIKRARGLIIALDTATNNLDTVLAAREMNPSVFIIAKAVDHNSHDELIRAGANKTVSPNEVGGNRMALLLLKPSVITFLDTITHSENNDLNLNEVVIDPNSSLCNLTLMEANIPEQTDLIITAIKEKGQKSLVFNPNKDYILTAGQTLIVLGDDRDIDRLRELASS